MSPDYESKVFINMPGILVYSDGDNVTLTWTPTDVLPAEIEFSSYYSVYLNVELYLHDFREGWYFYNNLGIVENVGFLFIDSLPQGPYHDLLVPAAIQLSMVDSETLPQYILPLAQTGQIGIWSPVFYKESVRSSDTSPQDFCPSWVEGEREVRTEFLQQTHPCPCRVEQARIGNSMFIEQRSTVAVQQSRFLYPGADTCFLSTSSR